jgi:hypothetical protein
LNNHNKFVWYRSRHYDAARGRFGQADKLWESITRPIIYSPYIYVAGIVGFTSAYGFNLAFESIVEKFEIIDKKEVDKNEALKYLLEMNKHMDESQKSIEKNVSDFNE